MPRPSLLTPSSQTQNKDFAYPARAFNVPQLINGRLVGYLDNPETYLTKAYNINDIIYSIVNLIMDKCRCAPWGIYQVVDETAYKSLQGMQRKSRWSQKDFILTAQYQRKALRLVENPGKWGELIKYPNQYDTFNDYVANGIGWECLMGNNYTWANLLGAGANKGIPAELNPMPAQFIDIYTTDTFPTRIVKYGFSTIPLLTYDPKEILHERTWNPDWRVNGSQMYGVSPIRASLKRIQNGNSSLDAQTNSFQNEGIKGFMHLKATPGAVGDSEALVQEVQDLKAQVVGKEWRGTENRGRIGVGGYDMGWIPIGLSSEEMELIESQKWTLRMLCNPFGVPSQLLNDDQRAYNNFAEAEKSLTMRACLPRLTRKRDSLTRMATTNWGLDKRYVIDFDMSVFGELQEDMKDMVAYLTPLMDRGLPLNRVLELMQLEKIDDPYYDQPRVTTQMGESFEDYKMNDVETDLIDESEENL